MRWAFGMMYGIQNKQALGELFRRLFSLATHKQTKVGERCGRRVRELNNKWNELIPMWSLTIFHSMVFFISVFFFLCHWCAILIDFAGDKFTSENLAGQVYTQLCRSVWFSSSNRVFATSKIRIRDFGGGIRAQLLLGPTLVGSKCLIGM